MQLYIKDYSVAMNSYCDAHVIVFGSLLVRSKGGPIPLFSDTFDTKYRAENFTNFDTDTNAYRQKI